MKRWFQIAFAAVVVIQTVVVFLLVGDVSKRDRRIARLEETLLQNGADLAGLAHHPSHSGAAATFAEQGQALDQ
jgi:hypothetical protein